MVRLLELCVKYLTFTAWDSNLIKVNPLYLSVNWDSAGISLPPFVTFGIGY
jgi:hypothetical protein